MSNGYGNNRGMTSRRNQTRSESPSPGRRRILRDPQRRMQRPSLQRGTTGGAVGGYMGRRVREVGTARRMGGVVGGAVAQSSPGMGNTYRRRLASASRFSRIAGNRIRKQPSSSYRSMSNNSGRNHLQTRVQMIQHSKGIVKGPGSRIK